MLIKQASISYHILDLNFTSELNSIIFNLSESNYVENKDLILNSELIKVKEGLYKVLQTINTAAFYRSKQIQLYQNIIVELSNSIKQAFGENFTIKCIITNDYLRLSLINVCGFSLSNFITENFDEYRKNLHFISFFAPEIKKNGMEKVIQYYQLQEFCTEKFIKERNEGLNPQSLAHSIIIDDVNKFQEICSKSNISYNSIIHHSFLDSNTFIEKSDLTLIEYSAYYGSLNIFKFLLMNSVTFSKKLPLYAVVGGNYEIIHILEKNDEIKFTQESIEIAVLFHRNELVEYLRENYNLQIDSKCFNQSIISRNSECFKNYFIENKIELDRNEIMKILKNIFENNAVEFLKAFAIKFKNNQDFIRSIKLYSYISIKNGDFFTLEYLIHDDLFDVSFNSSEVENAFKKGYLDVIDIMLKETNNSINYAFYQNWTTLHFAAKYNNKDLINYALTKSNVNINIRNSQVL